MTRDYELGIILNPEVNEEETRNILDRVEQVVATHGGQTVKVNQWGRRPLAYPIERQRNGIYIFIDMILTPETVSELERTLKVSEAVLRHMMKKRDPKAIQKEREEREEREARAAAAAAAAATAAAAPVVPAESEEQPVAEVVEEPVVEESAPIPSEAELEDVPPAVEETVEETVES
ncbi:MAG TPA: 30S ribosomal protein S6 [Ktedonobacteraceae bacterium]|nr:30S ribosomal protein S6 [Ktedonobacteraceae bacterium]